jgi:hypothetical protein
VVHCKETLPRGLAPEILEPIRRELGL